MVDSILKEVAMMPMRRSRVMISVPTRQDVLNWVSTAWKSITVETLVHSFLVCGLANALDGSQDDLVSNDVPMLKK